MERSQVADIQRRRILAAMFEVARERGAGSVTVAHVVERSGVSRRTFYEIFEDRQDCFLAAFEEAVFYASERVLAAYRSEGGWRERIKAALLALLCFLDEEPLIGHLLIAESLVAGPEALGRRKRVLAHITSAIEEGRSETTAGALVPALTAEWTVGGVLSVIHSRLLEPGHAPLIDLAGPLMSMIALPYLGAAAARHELQRPVPVPAVREPDAAALLSDPFKGAGMRLTYRTVRVLTAIAEHPQASNRTIGEGAGIGDQGQVSKLLARLERIGLVCNTGLGPGQGAPNAWSLTPSGIQVVHTIGAHIKGSTSRGESE
jgi:AcrR family transcriptional regulator